ncbi:MAG: biotin--[acetyl-CoA-carboxylase] ligase [Phycisphaerales bacterium]
MRTAPLEQWKERLDAVVASDGEVLRRAIVIRETASTQDAARRLGAQPGDVVVAWRQTAGRGRLGRRWADTREDGVALSLVLPCGPPERLALAFAVGVAGAVEPLLDRPVGIKWPNDIVVERRKLAGILIEQSGALALAGVGLNVSQTTWPEELAEVAVSLAQLGARVDRLDAIVAVLESLSTALRQPDDVLVKDFTGRDALSGAEATLRNGRETVHGTVLRIDPLDGLWVRTNSGEVRLPAATTTILAQSSW